MLASRMFLVSWSKERGCKGKVLNFSKGYRRKKSCMEMMKIRSYWKNFAWKIKISDKV